MQEPLMTVQEIADYLGIKPDSVRALMRRRGITRTAGYPRSEVEAIERTQGRRTDLENKD